MRSITESLIAVVNGHNRLTSARELGAGKVTFRFLDAKTANEARSLSALQNIAEATALEWERQAEVTESRA